MTLDRLGLHEDALAALRLMMARPEGIVLVTGPTGSGKSTTLYSMLNRLDTESVNIMTLEDPVEYPMGRVRQTSVNEAVGLTFASGVRSLLRQDPDIILVGEIRDAETAEMAFRAAMTGHQVYSTLHANSAARCDRAADRDRGVARSPGRQHHRDRRAAAGAQVVPSLPSEPYEPVGPERRILEIRGELGDAAMVFRAAGCERCEHRGYRGRLALLELLRFDAEIDDMVSRRATTLRDFRGPRTRRAFDLSPRMVSAGCWRA